MQDLNEMTRVWAEITMPLDDRRINDLKYKRMTGFHGNIQDETPHQYVNLYTAQEGSRTRVEAFVEQPF